MGLLTFFCLLCMLKIFPGKFFLSILCFIKMQRKSTVLTAGWDLEKSTKNLKLQTTTFSSLPSRKGLFIFYLCVFGQKRWLEVKQTEVRWEAKEKNKAVELTVIEITKSLEVHKPGWLAPGQSAFQNTVLWTLVLQFILDEDSELPREQQFPDMPGGKNAGEDLSSHRMRHGPPWKYLTDRWRFASPHPHHSSLVCYRRNK